METKEEKAPDGGAWSTLARRSTAELAIGQTRLIEMLTKVEDYAAALTFSSGTSVCRLSIGTCALGHGRAKRSALSSAAPVVLVTFECCRRGRAWVCSRTAPRCGNGASATLCEDGWSACGSTAQQVLLHSGAESKTQAGGREGSDGEVRFAVSPALNRTSY